MSASTSDRVRRAAEILAEARRSGTPLSDLPEAAAPGNEAEAWAIQREVLRLLGLTVGGWKCAAPPGRPQSGACIAREGFLTSPARLALPAGRQMGIEGEIAVRLGADLPGRADGHGYGRDEVLAAVAAAMPAIELVQSRFRDSGAVSALAGMADSIGNAGFVAGPERSEWRSLDLAQLRVRLAFDGEEKVNRVGGNPSGDPILPLVWLANKLIESGTLLRAGEIVTTGSCTGLLFVPPGTRVEVEFEELGRASIELDPA